MNNKLKNEILIEGYITNKDLENKSFLIKNNDEEYEFKYNEEFNALDLNDVSFDELVRVKGSFDQNEEGLFLRAEGILVLQDRNGDE